MCHQTVGLVARHLEANGIPTLIIGSAIDIIETCGVPRFYFVDFPLGNPCGKPYDVQMQSQIVDEALDLFEKATTPNTTVKSTLDWGSHEWRDSYMHVDESDREKLRRMGEERRREREQRRKQGRVRTE